MGVVVCEEEGQDVGPGGGEAEEVRGVVVGRAGRNGDGDVHGGVVCRASVWRSLKCVYVEGGG